MMIYTYNLNTISPDLHINLDNLTSGGEVKYIYITINKNEYVFSKDEIEKFLKKMKEGW